MKPTKKNIEKFLKHKLSTDARWVLKALLTIYNLHIVDQYKGYGKRGFTRYDKEILSPLGLEYQIRRSLPESKIPVLFDRMPKYWKQIYEVSAKEKIKQMVKNK